MKIQFNMTKTISKLAHKFSPHLGKVYDSNPVFWNDGIVGFVIGVPLTWILYQPVVAVVHEPALQFILYIGCAFVSFVGQHILRRKWVFRHD